MRLLILALLIAVSVIPSVILSFILMAVFPHIPMPLLLLLNVVVIAGGYFMIVRSRMAYYNSIGDPEAAPSWVKRKNAVLVFAVIGSLIGSAAMYDNNKAKLFIDNGTDHSLKFTLKHSGSFEIPAHSFTEKTVVVGSDNDITYNGATKKLNIDRKGNWLLNVDTQNTYIRTSVVYKSKSIFTRDNEKDMSMPDFSFVKEEFFNTETDYVFDAPESIRGDRSQSGPVTKTVLLRVPKEDLPDDKTDSTEIR